MATQPMISPSAQPTIRNSRENDLQAADQVFRLAFGTSSLGAVHPGKQAKKNFQRLLSACEALAVQRKLSKLLAGVNLGRHRAYWEMLAFGFRTAMQGVSMHRANAVGYDRTGIFAVDDWR